jgi:branched-subunit amino acid permease
MVWTSCVQPDSVPVSDETGTEKPPQARYRVRACVQVTYLFVSGCSDSFVLLVSIVLRCLTDLALLTETTSPWFRKLIPRVSPDD